MAIQIRVNGQVYENFISASVSSSLKTLSGSFSLAVSANERELLPIKMSDTIEILIDDNVVLSGYLDKLSGDHSSSSHTISLTGRDKTADIIDSTVSSKKEYKGPFSLKKLIENVLRDSGIKDIKVIDEVGNLDNFTKSDSISAEIGQTIFDFIDTYASKRQVLLTTDGLGNLVITRGASENSGITLVKLKSDPTKRNNILSSSINIDNSQRFNKYIVQTQANPIFSLSSSSPEKDTNINSSAIDSEIRASRVLEFQAEESLTDATAKQRAEWEANLRRSNSFTYTAVVQGHSYAEGIWKVNTLVAVIDEYWDISSDGLLVSDIEYSYGLDGTLTKLTFVYPESYTVQAELDQATAAKQDLGGLFK